MRLPITASSSKRSNNRCSATVFTFICIIFLLCLLLTSVNRVHGQTYNGSPHYYSRSGSPSSSPSSPSSSPSSPSATYNQYAVEQSVMATEEIPMTPVPPPPPPSSPSSPSPPPKIILCPPADLLRPCKCDERPYGTVTQTLLSCNGTEVARGQRSAGLEQTLHRISKRLSAAMGANNPRAKHFDWLHIANFEEMRKVTRNFFAGLRFRNLVIENAPKLTAVHPGAFKLVTDRLRYIYAYNTGLEHYRRTPMEAPFGGLKNLTEMHIASKSNICPPKEIIAPCECTIRQNPLLPFEIGRQILQLRCIGTRTTTYNVSRIFNRLSELGQNTRSTWYFDEVVLRNVTELGANSFGAVDFAELHIEDADQLASIAPDCFQANSTLQKLRISGANFASDRLGGTFEAMSRLPTLRSLFIWSANFEFVPEYAFSRPQPFLKEIVLYGNNIRAIGSYSFANLANLEQLRIDGNNIILVDKYALATNYSSAVPLQVTLVSNNFRENSFAFMSLAGALRPLAVSLAEVGGCFWELAFLDEAVFAPFLDKPANRLYLEPECELRCERCEMRWLVEMPKHAQRRVTLLPESPYRTSSTTNEGEGKQSENSTSNSAAALLAATGYVPCRGGANLFDIYEHIDWEKECS